MHGGAWASGDRLNNAPLDEALAKSGIVVLAIDFRMPPAHRYPDLDRRHQLRDPLAEGACARVRQPARAGLGARHVERRASAAARRAEAERSALCVGEAGGGSGEDARLPYIVLCWPISDPLARYRMVKEKGNSRLVEAHDAYWASEAEMAEGNPHLILERGEAATPLPPAIVVQGTADDNVTPDMADRFAAAYRARGGTLDLHKFAGQPHTFIPRDPASEASRQATEKLRDFVLKQAGRSGSEIPLRACGRG